MEKLAWLETEALNWIKNRSKRNCVSHSSFNTSWLQLFFFIFNRLHLNHQFHSISFHLQARWRPILNHHSRLHIPFNFHKNNCRTLDSVTSYHRQHMSYLGLWAFLLAQTMMKKRSSKTFIMCDVLCCVCILESFIEWKVVSFRQLPSVSNILFVHSICDRAFELLQALFKPHPSCLAG